MTPTDPLAADDAIIAEAGDRFEHDGFDHHDWIIPALRAIADKRGRALRVALDTLHRGTQAIALARIREILEGSE